MKRKQIRTLKKDEIIFREGEEGDCAYLIESGRVIVYVEKNGQEIPLKILGKGEIFGEMSMIDNSLRSASCKTKSDVKLIVVTKDQLRDRIRVTDPIVLLLLRAFLDRLRVQNDSIRGRVTSDAPTLTEQLQMEREVAVQRIELENQIATGLENDEFLPYYQPIYDLNKNEICGCEALLRWKSVDGKIISPGEFIDYLEQSSLIIDVGRKIIEKAIRDLKVIQDYATISPDFFVSINISGRQFSDINFLSHLESVRSKYNVNAHHIKLEVTERIMTEGPQAIMTLQQCRGLGYRIAIDDFGTGFSSLQYLAAMPLNDLKVDRSFVSEMMKNEKSLSIVRTLLFMAGLLNLNLVAEGIETKEQLRVLMDLGVKMGQGFLFCRPISFNQLMQMLTRVDEQQAA